MSLKTVLASIGHAVHIGGSTAKATLSTAALATVHQLAGSLAGAIAASAEQASPIGAAIASVIAASNAAAAAEVFGANVPDTNRPARKVIVAKADGTEVAFFIPEDGPAPDTSEAISWGPHHAWWPGEKVEKLSWKMAP